MALPLWPVDLPQAPERRSWSGGPREDRAVFEPDVGPPLLAARTTADTWEWNGTFPMLTRAQVQIFYAFWGVDLRRGTLPFLWIDPVLHDEARWIFGAAQDRAWSIIASGGRHFDLSLTLIRLPG
ncbi:hypothetical protein [Rhodovulum steppense]|uniref:Uncharacterized protein n=1 Tax=Rhodovulum steppense TaxID=540251 RepID=A0A4R1YV58_9RHOB|nr:hypothetical protein [Rhodovulum steppense]TCM84777.1 hypothetical protein EV216_11095 [Rhodovulum steppense]